MLRLGSMPFSKRPPCLFRFEKRQEIIVGSYDDQELFKE
jgi:hypothetical protein